MNKNQTKSEWSEISSVSSGLAYRPVNYGAMVIRSPDRL